MSVSPPDTGTGPRRVAGLAALAAALAAVMVAGVLVLGRVASSGVQAMVLTTVFLLAVGVGVVWLTRRRRAALVTLGATYLAVGGVTAVLLGLPLVTDDVVDEDVVRVDTAAAGGNETAEPSAGAGDADPTASPDGGEPATAEEPAGPVALASGGFEDRDHPGTGTATLVDTGEGATVLTLTEFATDNGPDLFVYLVPADAPAGSVDGFVDLGRLRGNQGDQQYDVPADVDAGAGWRVVVWCRAFSVTFTEATLA